MQLEKKGPGIKITQSDPAIIKVIEGSSTARLVGVIILLGGALLAWSSGGKFMNLTFIFGVLLIVFGMAVATQRYVMILNKLHGTWSYGGDVFFMISFKSRGLLTTLGSVHISKCLSINKLFSPNSSLLSKFYPPIKRGTRHRDINYMPVVKFIERLDLK